MEKIQIESVHLAELSTKLKIGPEDYENYLREEHKYLAGLRTKPANEQAQAEYMELLFDLDSLQSYHCLQDDFFPALVVKVRRSPSI